MKVLFISTSCSQKKYRKVYQMRDIKLIDPQQKFCQLLIDGMSKSDNVEIECLSAIPVSASTVAQKRFEEEIELVTPNLKYHYLGFINGKIARYFTLYLNCRKAVRSWIKRNKEEKKVIVCDVLPYYIAKPALVEAKNNGIKIVGIVTDLPLLSTKMKKRRESFLKKIGIYVFQHMTNRSLSTYDAFIPLTESINQFVNHTGKPSLIIEGSVDINELDDKREYQKQKIMLYAGGIYEKYGLKNLVNAFVKANTHGYELHIYGEGSYVEELKSFTALHTNVKYMGLLTLEQIVKKEKEAMILVNPRPSKEEFSRYSFPSKTLEYMVSGTPLLTTKLPGIPDEYFRYVYTFEGEDVNSMAKIISRVTSLNMNALNKKGLEAFKFVIFQKNNNVQGKRIIDFLQNLEA